MRASENESACMPGGAASAAGHAVAWLVFGNAVGVMIAVLLLLPRLNLFLGEWTYGRWMMAHMNSLLFGWCGLPLLGFLFRVYGADRGQLAAWCRPVVWLWSAALATGCVSWLSGHSSGKLFLDWSGYARVLFPLSMAVLWFFLTVAFVRSLLLSAESRWAVVAAKATGLLALFAVPFAIYFASNPAVYPFVNPDTGGPTGQSQLESSLGVVLILLAMPFGLTTRKEGSWRRTALAWALLAASMTWCMALGRADVSHRVLAQWLSLSSMVVWIPLIPAYYGAFEWSSATRQWRTAFLWWWTGLVITGCIFFLPGVLDRFKFTDGLVGHSLTAVAGFLTAYVIFAMVQLLGEQGAWLFNRPWSFWSWNLGVLAYVVLMTGTGWIEGGDPGFTMVSGTLRNVCYFIRLLTGLAMLAGSVEWLVAALRSPSSSRAAQAAPNPEAA